MADPAYLGAREASRVTTRYVVDSTAYNALTAGYQDLRRAKGVRARDLNGFDFAFQRIYRGLGFNPPFRKATGALLARDLRHDGHRAHDRRAKHEVLGVSERDPSAEPLAVWEEEVDAATRVVERAAAQLPSRKRLALALHARGLFDEATTLAHLGVKPRQAQNLANDARAELLGDAEVHAAYETLLDALGAGQTDAVRALLDDVFAGLADVSPRSS